MTKKSVILKKTGFSFFLPFLISLSTAILLTVAQFAMICYLLCKIDLPLTLLSPLSTIAACLSTLLAGMLLAYLLGQRGMLTGFAQGIFLFLILLISALIGGKTSFSALAFAKLIAFCAAGGIGGYLGIVLADKRRRKRQH